MYIIYVYLLSNYFLWINIFNIKFFVLHNLGVFISDLFGEKIIIDISKNL